MAGSEEADFSFDFSEWTVVDEDVSEEDKGYSGTKSDGGKMSAEMLKSKASPSVTSANNQTASNKTYSVAQSVPKSATSSASEQGKSVTKSNVSSGASKHVKSAAQSIVPGSAGAHAKSVAQSNVSSSASAPAKNEAKSNVSSSASAPVKSVAQSVPTANASAKNVAHSNVPIANVPAKSVAHSNVTSCASAPTKNAAQSNANVSVKSVAQSVANSVSAPVKNVAQLNMPSGATAPAKNVAQSNVPSGASAPTKNISQSNLSGNSNAPIKNVARPNVTSSANTSAKSVAQCNMACSSNAPVKSVVKTNVPSCASTPAKNVTQSSADNSTSSENVVTKTVANTLANKPGAFVSTSQITSFVTGSKLQIKTTVAPLTSPATQRPQVSTAQASATTIYITTPVNSPVTSVRPQFTTSLASKSAENKNGTTVKPTITSSVSVTSSKAPIAVSVSKPTSTPPFAHTLTKPVVSTVNKANQLTLQKTSSQAQMKSTTQVKQKPNEVGNIAAVMESVDKKGKNVENSHCDMEEISDTELTDTMDIAKFLVSKTETAKGAGMKREFSPNRDGPAAKKAKLPNSAEAVVNSANAIKTGTKQQSPVSSNSTPKGSFGAVKSPASKLKTQPASTQSTKTVAATTVNKTNKVESKNDTPANTTSTNVPVRRIIHRFHRMTQTVSKQVSNKLLQCLIRIPSIDGLPKPKSHFGIQTLPGKVRDEVFYQRTLPDTVRPAVFKVVSAFNVNHPGNRNIITGSFDYGISLGHVTAADVEKSMFRENLLSKSAHYNLYFDRHDFGVLDLLFSEEEQFLSVLTQIRKMKIGPRHLVVTYCKNLTEKDRAEPGYTVSCVKATIIYNQNFASTSFLTYSKAPLWNKPKVEETLTIHNLPAGIPLDFLKIIIPDAITVELDDKKQKVTQEGSRVRLGMNRKNSGDRFLKLFAHMYMNNECLAFSVSGTPIGEVPELSDILNEKETRKRGMKIESTFRELKAVPRDISGQPLTTGKDNVDVIMHVDAVVDVEMVLTGKTSGWKGPSSVEKLQQALFITNNSKSSTSQGAKNNAKLSMTQGNKSRKQSALSDVSEDFSEISDTSYIEGETAVPRKKQKKNELSTADSKTSQLSGKKTNTTEPQRRVRLPLAPTGKSILRKSLPETSNTRKQITEKQDRFKDKDFYHSPSKQSSDKSTHGSHTGRIERTDVGRGKNESISIGSLREKEGYTPRQNITEDGARNVSESARERLRRERLALEEAKRALYEKYCPDQLDECESADNRGSQIHSASRSVSQRSEERDDRRPRVNLEVDRHGKRIVSVWDRDEPERKLSDSFVPDKFEDKWQDKVITYDIHSERDNRRGERLSDSLLKRLGSLERNDEIRGRKERKVVRSRSPGSRHIRGRSVSPRRQPQVSHSLARPRRFSPAPAVGIQNRFAGMRSRDPHQRQHSSGFPTESMEDEAVNEQEGAWLSQPPSIHSNTCQQGEKGRSHNQNIADLPHREGMWKTNLNSRTTNNQEQTEWKSTIVALESEKSRMEANNNRRVLENFVEHVIATRKKSSVSEVSGGRRSPSQFVPGIHDPTEFFGKMREIYGSGVNFTDTGRGVGPNEISNAVSVAPTGVQSGIRGGKCFGNRKDGPRLRDSSMRPFSHVSMSPGHDRGADFSSYDREQEEPSRYDREQEEPLSYGRGLDESPRYGRGSEDPSSYGRGPKEPTSYGRGPEESTGYNRVPEESTGYSRGSEESTDYGNGPEESKGYGAGTEEFSGYGGGTEESSGYDRGAKEPINYGRGTKEPTNFGRGPKEPTNSGTGSKEPTNYGRGPKESTNYGRGPKEPTNYGRGSAEPTNYGRESEETSSYGRGPEEFSGYGIVSEETGHHFENRFMYDRNMEESGNYQGFDATECDSNQMYDGESDVMSGPGGYRDSNMMSAHLNAEGYHQNPSFSLPPPIPPPVAPPLFNPNAASSQEKLSQLENLAQMLADDIEQQQNQSTQNAARGMWNTSHSSTTGPQLPGPRPYLSGPSNMSFSGPPPPPPFGQNINFSGPPPPFMPPNIHPPHDVRGMNPPPWSHNNFF